MCLIVRTIQIKTKLMVNAAWMMTRMQRMPSGIDNSQAMIVVYNCDGKTDDSD